MTTVTLDEAEARLSELLLRLRPGEELTITHDGRPLAKVERAAWSPRVGTAGCYRKEGFWMAPDFDAPLEDFKEYME